MFNHELLLIGIENIWHALIVIITSLIGILVFTSATQRWFINKLRWYEVLVFLIISLSFLAPEFVLNKFSPKYEQQKLSAESIQFLNFDPEKEVHIKVTRRTDYGDRYKLFVINKGSFDEDFNIEIYGLKLAQEKNKVVVKKLDWKGLAKKSGIENGDIISNLKIENLERPNKGVVYLFAAFLLFIFGSLNYQRSKF